MPNGFVTSAPGSRYGSSLFGTANGKSEAAKFVCPGSGSKEITEIGFWMSVDAATTAALRFAIYTHDVANDCPNTQVANSETTEVTSSNTSVVKVSHTYTGTKPRLTGGVTYWLCTLYADVNGNTDWITTGGGGAVYGDPGSYPTWPTNSQYNAMSAYAGAFSIYAVYVGAVPTASLDGWSYRKIFSLSRASGAVTNYQMKLLVGESSGATGENVDCGGHCKTDFSDLRFTKADGTTLLDYWIESVSGATPNQLATVWIEFDSIGTTPTDFYMYYGNAGASAASNGETTFPLFDHFTGGTLDSSKWDTIGSVTVTTAADGGSAVELHVTDTTDNAGIKSKSNLSSCAIRGRIKFGSVAYAYFMLRRAAATVTFASINFGDVSKCQTYDAGNSQSTPGSIDGSAYHVFDVQYLNNTSQAYYDNGSLIATHTTLKLTSTDMRLFFCGFVYPTNHPTILADWLLVRQYVASEPLWGSWGSEETFYNESAALELSAGLTRGSILSAINAASLALSAGLAHAGLMNIAEAVALVLSTAQDQSGQMSFDEAIALAVQAADARSALAALNAAASFGVLADEDRSGQTVMTGALSLGITADMTRASVLEIIAAHILGIAVSKAQSGGISIQEAVTFAVAAAKAQSANVKMSAGLSLDIDADHGSGNVLSANEAVSLVMQALEAQAASMEMDEDVSLGITAGVLRSGLLMALEELILAVAAEQDQSAGTVFENAMVLATRAADAFGASASMDESVIFPVLSEDALSPSSDLNNALTLGLAADLLRASVLAAVEACAFGIAVEKAIAGGANFTEAVILAANAISAQSATTDMSAGLSLGISAEQGTGNAISADAVIALSLAMAMLQAGDVEGGAQTYDEAASLALAAGMSQASIGTLQDAVTLATAAGVGFSGQSILVNALVLQATASMIQASVGSFSASLNLDTSAGAAFGTALILQASALFGAASGLSGTDGLSLEDAVSLGIKADVAQAVSYLLSAAVGFNVQVAQGNATVLTAEARTALAVACEQIDAAMLISTNYLELSLSIVAGMQQWGIVPQIATARHMYDALARKREYDATERKRVYDATARKRETDAEEKKRNIDATARKREYDDE